MAERLAPGSRHQFVHGGRVIYEWDQTLAEVNMYVPVPPDMRAKEIFCDITKGHLTFGRQGNPPFLDVSPRCTPGGVCTPAKLCMCHTKCACLLRAQSQCVDWRCQVSGGTCVIGHHHVLHCAAAADGPVRAGQGV